MHLRRVVLVLHRWLGMTSSAILAIVGGSGAILVWQDWEALRGLQRYAGSAHARLALGQVGSWLVVAATAAAVILELSGFVLWWKRKTLTIRFRSGWWRLCYDLHHVSGVVGLPIMLTLAVTGLVILFALPDDPALRRLVMRLHLGGFPWPIKVLYTMATLGFVIQGATGLVVWWKPRAPGRGLPD